VAERGCIPSSRCHYEGTSPAISDSSILLLQVTVNQDGGRQTQAGMANTRGGSKRARDPETGDDATPKRGGGGGGRGGRGSYGGKKSRG
jgi:hypothetical protein